MNLFPLGPEYLMIIGMQPPHFPEGEKENVEMWNMKNVW